MSQDAKVVQDYYDRIGSAFDASYDWDGPLYPSNRIRMEHALYVIAARVPTGARVLDAGCGTGIVMAELLARGYDAKGFDFSEVAVKAAQRRLGPDAWRVWSDDLENASAITGGYDAALVIGAFTHPVDTARALPWLHGRLRPGGVLVVELRNEVFDLYTANEYTIRSLRRWLPNSLLVEEALAQLGERTYRRLPIPPASEAQVAHEQFFSVPSVWRNPLTVAAEYRSAGFEPVDTLYFHWHAVPPVFEALDPVAFRAESLALEKHPRDWRGLFMASAFLLVCRRT